MLHKRYTRINGLNNFIVHDCIEENIREALNLFLHLKEKKTRIVINFLHDFKYSFLYQMGVNT